LTYIELLTMSYLTKDKYLETSQASKSERYLYYIIIALYFTISLRVLRFVSSLTAYTCIFHLSSKKKVIMIYQRVSSAWIIQIIAYAIIYIIISFVMLCSLYWKAHFSCEARRVKNRGTTGIIELIYLISQIRKEKDQRDKWVCRGCPSQTQQ
jgi:hypothetical protein